ncbi:MAG: hypothetical protein M3291_03890 [Actinomycetota bacterium]|nr:hypothetical protein [Actinomycetota bacterium]
MARKDRPVKSRIDVASRGGAMRDDCLDEPAPREWALEQELEIAAEVYGPEPKGLRTPPSDLSDEELLERYRSLLGFDLTWE